MEKCWESYLVVESWFGDFAANRSIETAVDEKEGPRGRIKMAKDLRVETALEGGLAPSLNVCWRQVKKARSRG